MAKALSVEWLGRRRYAEALALQEEAVADRIADRTPDRLLLVEHPAVVTLGRSSDPENLRLPRYAMRAKGVEVFEAGRGGDVTFHAPGQLVGYPILDLDALDRRDVHDHLRRLEAGLMDALEETGIPTKRVGGRTGVFVDLERSPRSEGPDRKIASIGVGVRKWVTFHGFALNVTIDLAGFDVIVPCGLHDVEMTSVARELQASRAPETPSPGTLDGVMRERVARALTRRLDGMALSVD